MGRLVSCMRKTRYATKTEAIAVATRALQRPDRTTTYLRYYHCPHCKGFHLTSKPLLHTPPPDRAPAAPPTGD